MSEISDLPVPELQQLLSAAVIASLFPHIALLKALLEKGVLSRYELNAQYALLDIKAYPHTMAVVLEPIWAQLRRELDLPEGQS